jgi:hypothetical protein
MFVLDLSCFSSGRITLKVEEDLFHQAAEIIVFDKYSPDRREYCDGA